MDAWGHQVARHRAAGIETVLRQSFADDVTVGHHADQPVVLSNGNGADVMLTHQFREFGDRRVWTNPVDALVHCIFDFHGRPPLLKLVYQPRFPSSGTGLNTTALRSFLLSRSGPVAEPTGVLNQDARLLGCCGRAAKLKPQLVASPSGYSPNARPCGRFRGRQFMECGRPKVRYSLIFAARMTLPHF